MSVSDDFLKNRLQSSNTRQNTQTKPCPYCGEQIVATAKKCRFCGELLDAQERARERAAVAQLAKAYPVRPQVIKVDSGCMGCARALFYGFLLLIILSVASICGLFEGC